MVDTPAVEEPGSPDISHENPARRKEWFGHPRQLARLFTTEMWERFGYYGMRALLTLYLTKHFVLGDHASTGLYGGYGLVIVDRLSDRFTSVELETVAETVRSAATLGAYHSYTNWSLRNSRNPEIAKMCAIT